MMRAVIVWKMTLILVLFRVSVIMTCPEDCVCSYYNGRHPMDCSSNGLTQMVSNIPEWTTSIRMDGNELRVLDLTFCDECNFFQELSFRYNDISKISYSRQTNMTMKRRSLCDHVPQIFSRLVAINLKGNAIRSLPKCLLFAFPKLQYLNLDENQIVSVRSLNVFDYFFHTHTLNELHIRRNQISQLIRKDLYTSTIGFRRLRVLDLSENRIHTIESGVFTFFDELQDLDLSSNKIGFLPDFCFATKGRGLRTIDLSGNRIDWISSHGLAGLPNLQVLDLRDNMIQCIYPAKWSTCQYLPSQSFGTIDRGLEHFRRRFSVSFSSNLRVNIAGNRLVCDCRLTSLLHSCTSSCDVDELMCYAPLSHRGESLSRVIGQLQCA